MPERVKKLHHSIVQLLQIVTSCLELGRTIQAMEALSDICKLSEELREQLAVAEFGGGTVVGTKNESAT